MEVRYVRGARACELLHEQSENAIFRAEDCRHGQVEPKRRSLCVYPLKGGGFGWIIWRDARVNERTSTGLFSVGVKGAYLPKASRDQAVRHGVAAMLPYLRKPEALRARGCVIERKKED